MKSEPVPLVVIDNIKEALAKKIYAEFPKALESFQKLLNALQSFPSALQRAKNDY